MTFDPKEIKKSVVYLIVATLVYIAIRIYIKG